MDIEALYQIYLRSNGVCTDTRKLKEGEIFFALKGDNFDGNTYAETALEEGALAAVVDDDFLQGEDFFPVSNVLETLQALARHHRTKLDFPIIALTGSNGKTTTKELIVSVLQRQFKVGYTQGNLNNHIGVPLTLLQFSSDLDYGVVEMGANHQREIAFLADIARPTEGLITNYGKAHLEGFGGPEGVIKGKSELWDHLRANQGKAWVNSDDPIQMEKTTDLDRETYGTDASANYQVETIAKDQGPHLTLRYQDQEIKSQLTGAYNLGNIACAVAIGAGHGMKPVDIALGIESYQPANDRSQIYRTGKNLLIRDFYNANPSSMKEALNNLELLKQKEKWAILGDMFEMGVYRESEHQKIVDQLEAMDLSERIIVGQAFSETKHPKCRAFLSTEDLGDWLREAPVKDALILLKGSRGMQLERLLPHL